MTIHRAVKDAVADGDLVRLRELKAIAQRNAKYSGVVSVIQGHIDTLEA